MDRFGECLPFVLEREGGFVDHPNDRGGATNKGITQRTFDEWCERKGVPAQSVKFISDNEVRAIYEEQYWNPVRAAVVPAPLDLVLFDSAVQHGPARAVRILQDVVDVFPTTGYFGPITLEAVKRFAAKYSVEALVARYLQRRSDFYQAIVSNDPSQRVFEKGWQNRLALLQDVVTA